MVQRQFTAGPTTSRPRSAQRRTSFILATDQRQRTIAPPDQSRGTTAPPDRHRGTIAQLPTARPAHAISSPSAGDCPRRWGSGSPYRRSRCGARHAGAEFVRHSVKLSSRCLGTGDLGTTSRWRPLG
uniref:Uncharacterized protein n=1 Tax=Oryza sativa subsp. japonica TaxID=39947 RepID=Q652J1_ORYSJ|nr:hypothetical protein [Oryza sativa Japonica Group]BAD46276.1 hypothetical protein [Oryza sativa Japonica Group]